MVARMLDSPLYWSLKCGGRPSPHHVNSAFHWDQLLIESIARCGREASARLAYDLAKKSKTGSGTEL